jgi:anti-anti-sigma factor
MSPTDWPTTSAPQLEITLGRSSPTTTQATIVGEIELATVPLLLERLTGAMHDETLDLLDIDLTEVKFLDCAGIGALVGVYNTAVQSGRHMQLTHPQPFVRHILDLTGLLRVLTAELNEPEPIAVTTSTGSS